MLCGTNRRECGVVQRFDVGGDQAGSISPLMIFTICDASANSVSTIAKVTLTKSSLGRSISIDNFCCVHKESARNTGSPKA